jgi:hypothetical protein
MNCVGCQANYHLFLMERPKRFRKEIEMIAISVLPKKIFLKKSQKKK